MSKLENLHKALKEVSEVSPLLTKEFADEIQKKSEEFLKDLQESKFIKVPLVGVFSAGKSSLLNVFTEKPGMLPVDTTPETAVAYELYYAPTECIELYRDGKKIDEVPIAEIKTLATKPGDIAKVYCTSQPIKRLQERGLVLVDMPGIGSGIERHDAAIFNYIHSGTAFVLLVDAEQGALRSSTLAFMEELQKYNLHPAVLISKIDKKPSKEIQGIVEYVTYQLEKLGDTKPFISTISAVNNDLEGFNRFLDSIDSEALVASKMGKQLKLLVNSVIEQLKIRVNIRNKDIANVEEKIKKIEEEIANVKAEFPADTSMADSPEKSTQDILDRVNAALEAKATDIAQMIIDGDDQESIKSFVIGIVRSEIIISLKEESKQYSEAIGKAVQESVKNLAAIEIDVDFMNDFNSVLQIVTPLVETLSVAGGIWGSIAKVILPFLPQIIIGLIPLTLNWLFGKSEEEALEEMREKVMDKCINKITIQLKPTIYKLTIDNQKRIQDKIQEELVSKMEKVKAGLKEKLADTQKSKEVVFDEIQQLNAAIDKLNGVCNTL